MKRPYRFAPVAGLSIAMLMLAGCGTTPKVPRASPSLPSSASRPVPSPGLNEANYVSSAGSADLFIIKASELAQQRGQALRVREAAGRLISSHKGTSQQLSFAGRRLDLLPSATMTPVDQAAFDRLNAAVDFDSAYRSEIRAAVQRSLKIHRDYARLGSSPTLLPVAKMAAEAAERDLRLLGYL